MQHRTSPARQTTPTRRRHRRRAAAPVVGALALVAVLAGCGSNDDAGGAASDTTAASSDATGEQTETTEATDGPSTVSDEPICAAWLATDAAGTALGDPDASPDDAEAATQAIADALKGVEAPTGLEDQLATANDAVAAALGGDPAAFEASEFNAALAELGAWVHDECGFEQVEVTTVDHAFEGIDGELAAGPVSFHVANEGADAHVVVLHRIADDSDVTADDLFADGQVDDEALAAETELVVSGAFAPPGGEGFVTADLAPGRYVVFCPIPAGFAGDGPPDPTADPHAALGMHAELTVA